MAETFVAIRRRPGGVVQRVCLKRILPGQCDNTDFVSMFFAEARMSAALSHSKIATVIDFGEHEGTYFMALELIDGCDLRVLLRSQPRRRLSPALTALITSDIAMALDHAHEHHDLVHRDVSPNNVLVSHSGDVKLTDFGVAKVITTSTDSGLLKGKIPYMAPEQAGGRKLDGRVDLFALGVMMQEMLSGSRPFDGRDNADTLIRILRGERRPVAEACPDSPPALVAICERLLAFHPGDRYPSAAALLEDLSDLTPGPAARRELGMLVSQARSPHRSGQHPAISAQGTPPGGAANIPPIPTLSLAVDIATDPTDAGFAPKAAPPPPPSDAARPPLPVAEDGTTAAAGSGSITVTAAHDRSTSTGDTTALGAALAGPDDPTRTRALTGSSSEPPTMHFSEAPESGTSLKCIGPTPSCVTPASGITAKGAALAWAGGQAAMPTPLAPPPQAGRPPGSATTGRVAAGGVAAGDLAAGDLAAGDLAAGDLAAGDLAAGDLAAGDLAAGGVAAGDLAAGDLAAGDVAAGGLAALRSATAPPDALDSTHPLPAVLDDELPAPWGRAQRLALGSGVVLGGCVAAATWLIVLSSQPFAPPEPVGAPAESRPISELTPATSSAGSSAPASSAVTIAKLSTSSAPSSNGQAAASPSAASPSATSSSSPSSGIEQATVRADPSATRPSADRHDVDRHDVDRPRGSRRARARARASRRADSASRASSSGASASATSEPRGELTVGVVPWGYVWINGRKVGETPVRRRLPPGTYRISAGPTRPMKTQTVEIRSGEATRVVLRLDTESGARGR